MIFIEIIIIGAIIGWLAAAVTGRREGILGSIVIGVVGALIGGVLSSAFTGFGKSFTAMSWSGIVWSFIGAVILSIILNAVQHNRVHR